jgi:hypothetical protein
MEPGVARPPRGLDHRWWLLKLSPWSAESRVALLLAPPPGAATDKLTARTLTNLYNQRPTWLDCAHQRPDEAVATAYGWPPDLPDEQILERLLALNLERSGAGGDKA